MATGDKGASGVQHILHGIRPAQSKVEVLTDGIRRFDLETAHTRAGDQSYQKWLPGDCYACEAQALAEQAREEQEAIDLGR